MEPPKNVLSPSILQSIYGFDARKVRKQAAARAYELMTNNETFAQRCELQDPFLLTFKICARVLWF